MTRRWWHMLRAACLFSCLVFPPTFGSIITLNGPCSPHVASHNPLLMSASSPAVIWPVFHLALIVILSSWRMWTDLMCFFFLFPQGFHQFLLNSWIYFIDLYGYSVLIYSVSVYYGFLKRFVMIPKNFRWSLSDTWLVSGSSVYCPVHDF